MKWNKVRKRLAIVAGVLTSVAVPVAALNPIAGAIVGIVGVALGGVVAPTPGYVPGPPKPPKTPVDVP